MKESKLEQDCNTLANRCGFANFKGSGRVGAADQIYIQSWFCFFVEFKRPDGGGKMSEGQKIEQQRVEEDEGHYHVCNDFEHFREILIQEIEFYNEIQERLIS